MENKRSEFKKLLEETVIPEVMSYEEREPLLKPLLEYVHSITPAKLFRYRDCSETQFDAFYNDRIYAGNAQKFNDPYDCLIRYDKQYLYNSIKQGASKEYIRKLRDCLREGEPFPEFVASLYGEERTKILKETILNATDEDIEKNKTYYIMAKITKKKSMPFGHKLSLILLAAAVILTLLQFVFKTFFDIDLGITFFGMEMF